MLSMFSTISWQMQQQIWILGTGSSESHRTHVSIEKEVAVLWHRRSGNIASKGDAP